MRTKLPNWAGHTVVCIASGPSLTVEDCALVKASGHPTIVTNTTFQRAPFADVVFGFDSRWWREYLAQVKITCPGARLMTASQVVAGVESVYGLLPTFANSGAVALALAVSGKASRVVLLGYDCQKTGGQTHWHPDHGKPLGNALSIDKWPRQMQLASEFAAKAGVPVVNVSRETSLKCFPRGDLEAALMSAAHA